MQNYASRDPPYFEEMMEVINEIPGDRIPARVIRERLEFKIGKAYVQALEALRKNPARFGLEKMRNPQYIDGRSERFYRRIR